MKLNIAIYSIILFLSASCSNQKYEIKDYGFPKKENDSLKVSLKLSEFENYGLLVDRIREITCNDSFPKMVFKKNKVIRNIYPIENCEPLIYDPEGKHYVTFRGGKPYKASTTIEIDTDSLRSKLKDDFSYYRNSNPVKNPESYLVIIESERQDNVDGIEDFLSKLTQEFDKLKADVELNISFWEVVPFLPPPPAMENEKHTG
ncbi:hypothetical protein NQT66_18485 [Cellulophaga baltica]|uniref:hypothetical protein n=1 Tax=Cellulophaga baltica TaxID=76594 RepID=UPI0021492ABB|nr:hypothetical protein [Cellulophaga baltica]MCR1026813.1 hypothetical protein [Cellulophaga baltica]